jgi:hypothetical protein
MNEAAPPSVPFEDGPVVHLPGWLVKAATLMGVWFAIALHITWCIALLLSSTPKETTAIHSLGLLWPNRYGLVLVLLAVAGCATAAIFMKPSRARLLMLVPQQLALGISASGAVVAIGSGAYPDGTHRDSMFLLSDQIPAVLALVIHSATIIYLALLMTKTEWVGQR